MITNSANQSFYITGGTLRADATSYVEREADKDLLAALLGGEYCYVLNTRQMGKSSLMVRTAAKLRETAHTVAILDLTGIGQNLTPEQWYDGLMLSLAEQLGMDEALQQFWDENQHIGPLQRFLGAIQKVILTHHASRIVIFVDEIDAVRSLPFAPDEFFAGIRALFNLRTEQTELARLTFCLLGVATPADLIRETRMSPFNVGRRIAVTDFTEAEARPLASRLPGAGATLARVLYWTGGNPYMTQRLCEAVAKSGDSANVDRTCESLFLTKSAQDSDDNLAFVRNRLLRSEADLSSLLDLYQKVRSGKRIPDDETNPLCGILKLSGVVKEEGGLLKVRNRIYDRVFDREWVIARMPDAELRRQRTAYRRGVLRTAVASAAIIAVTGILAGMAVQNARTAQRERRETRRKLYTSDMNVAQQALESGMPGRSLALLKAYLPGPGEEDLRTFEWRYLWRHCIGQSVYTYPDQGALLSALAISPDGRIMVTGDMEGTVKLWDTRTHQEIGILRGHKNWVLIAHFSPDGRRLITNGSHENYRLWDVATRRQLAEYPDASGKFKFYYEFVPDGRLAAVRIGPAHTFTLCDPSTLAPMQGAVFRDTDSWRLSSDGRTLVTVNSVKGVVRVWDAQLDRNGLRLRESAAHVFPPPVRVLMVGRDGRPVVLGHRGKTLTFWNRELTVRKAIVKMSANYWPPKCSRDGAMAAIPDASGTITLLNMHTGRTVLLRGHEAVVYNVEFQPDGKTLASVSKDRTIKLWDTGTTEPTTEIPGYSVSVSGDGRTIAVGGAANDGTVARFHLWDDSFAKAVSPAHAGAFTTPAAFSRDGRTLFGVTTNPTLPVTGPPESFQIRWWDARSGALAGELPRQSDTSVRVALSPDGSSIASAGELARTVSIWDVRTRRLIRTFPDFEQVLETAQPAFSPDGRSLIFGCADRTIRIWDLAGKKPARILMRFGDQPGPIAFSADGRMLAVGCWTGEIWVWDTRNFRLPIARFMAHQEGLGALAFSPDSKTLASGGWDGKVRLWNVLTWRSTLTLNGHKILIRSLQFSPDGNRLYSASNDGPVHIWRAASISEVASAISHSTR